uniref:Uncharacterized protein n=1 Tax=Ascaris lumbricoides TaxID=6252 RepID=A0A9J2PEC6_ASCLU
MCTGFFVMDFIDSSRIIMDQTPDSSITLTLFLNTLPVLLVVALLSQCTKKKGLATSKNASRSQSSSQAASAAAANPTPATLAAKPIVAVGEPPEAKANVEKQEQLAKPPSPPPPQPPDAIEKVKEDTAKPNPEDDQKKDDPTQNDESVEEKK